MKTRCEALQCAYDHYTLIYFSTRDQNKTIGPEREKKNETHNLFHRNVLCVFFPAGVIFIIHTKGVQLQTKCDKMKLHSEI